MGVKRVILIISSLVLVFAVCVGTLRPALAQTATPPADVRGLFDTMSPEERVGQLFLVAFTGTDTGDQSRIYDLIVNHHVGGAVLLNSNDNFAAPPDTVPAAYRLIRDLQGLEWNQASGATPPGNYIPLFIAMAQDGDGYPDDQILNGMTPLPSEMAIGATWDPGLANKVGTVLGREFSQLGINMVLGPGLDVLEAPNPSASGDMGVRAFGGDPYWVGEMGRAYISGLHAGSENRVLVIAKHFPGRGSSDRPHEEEVATVRKSLEQLKQIELAPFFGVTGAASAPEMRADGLLVSHIRYQGFQGNIRATTRPVSFDAQALADILNLPQFASWREQGGLIVSDDLGTQAVRRFYSSGGDLPARFVARDAFVAGNDVLYLGNITRNEQVSTYDTVVDILAFFNQKYLEDPAFAQRVDSAVLRILAQKHRIYGTFDIARVQVPEAGLAPVGTGQEITFEVARRSATLISPAPQDLSTLLPALPQVRDRMVFITDTLSQKQCSSCPEQSTLAVNALQSAIVKLYGPESGNQTSSFRLSSYSLTEVDDFMHGSSPPYLEADLNRANWVILALTDAGRGQPQLVSRFLSEHQDLLRDKRVILFSFGAPYYLDATDISRLTAYFALYSKQPPFLEVAARLLFQELTPGGASPVSVPGLGYDLITITAPDPDQVISLALDLPPASPAPGVTTPQPTPVALFKIGDTIAIRTGVIKDHNGHPVPDGTVVHFSITLTGEGGGILQQADAVTSQGVARVSFGLDKPGLLEIRTSSDPAVVSEVLQLDVSSGGQPAAVTVIVPALTRQDTSPTPQVPVSEPDDFVKPDGSPRFIAWLLVLLLLAVGSSLIFWIGLQLVSARWGIRWALLGLAGGLLIYNYLALALPGGARFVLANGMAGIIVATFLGLFLGWGIGWTWYRRAG